MKKVTDKVDEALDKKTGFQKAEKWLDKKPAAPVTKGVLKVVEGGIDFTYDTGQTAGKGIGVVAKRLVDSIRNRRNRRS